MFITRKHHEREKQELLGISNRLTDALLKNSDQGLFLLDAKDRVLPQVSRSLGLMFRRQDFGNLSFEKLLAPIVSVKTLTAVRNHIANILAASPTDAGSPQAPASRTLTDIEVRLTNADGSTQTAHYRFDFDAVDLPNAPRSWLVRVTDITIQVETLRELEELRSHAVTQGEILREVLHLGGARFGAFLQKAEASMTTIHSVLRKSARAEAAFRSKLEETVEEVDRMRRAAAEFKLTALEHTARAFEDALYDLRSRVTLSGSDFLPLAVKLDALYEQFALVKSFTMSASPPHAGAADPSERATAKNTRIIEAPPFAAAAAGSLGNTLHAFTAHVAEEQKKTVVLQTHGLHLVPGCYLTAVKNVAIQLIRNAVLHGVESPAQRQAAGKTSHGTLRLDFKTKEHGFDLLFEDDGGGLDPARVRAIAVERGVVTHEAATRMRDREAIKLIFKSRYTTLSTSATDTTHGAGMSLVRRYVHGVGGKIALASLAGHETRFKITLPPLNGPDTSARAELQLDLQP